VPGAVVYAVAGVIVFVGFATRFFLADIPSEIECNCFPNATFHIDQRYDNSRHIALPEVANVVVYTIDSEIKPTLAEFERLAIVFFQVHLSREHASRTWFRRSFWCYCVALSLLPKAPNVLDAAPNVVHADLEAALRGTAFADVPVTGP